MRHLPFALLLCSCSASIYHQPATPHPAVSRVFEHPFDAVWSGVVSWFASSNVTVDKIEKTSGLITARRTLNAGEDMLDVGVLSSSWNSHGLEVVAREVSLNVFVAPDGADRTVVTPNVFGSFRAVAYKGWMTNLEPLSYEGRAESTGVIETMILDHVARSLTPR